MSPLRARWYGLAAALCAAASPALAQPGAADAGRPVQSLDEILALAAGEAMQARWRALAESNQLPPLGTLVLPAQPQARRVRALAQTAAPQPAPVLAQQPGELDLVLGQGLQEFEGPLSVHRLELGRLTGRLVGRDASVDILFDLPGTQQRLDVAPRTMLRSTLRDELVGAANEEAVALSDDDGALLLYVNEGSSEPFRREFSELPLRVQQLPPDTTGTSSLRIQFGAREFELRPGERMRVPHGGEDYEIYVGPTSYPLAEERVLIEGEPFRVRLMVYRRRTPGS